MGRNSSHTAARPNLPPHHQNRGPRAEHALHHDYTHDVAHVKRRERTKDQTSATNGNLSRTLENDPRNKVVESWLAKTGGHRPDVAERLAHDPKPIKLHRRHASREVEHKVRYGPSYRPIAAWQTEGLHEAYQDTKPFTSTSERLGRRRRERSISKDSSLLTVADFGRTASDVDSLEQLPPEEVPVQVQRSRSSRQLVGGDEDDFSTISPGPEPVNFEKRARYTTRDDNYDTRKEVRRNGRPKQDTSCRDNKSKRQKRDSKRRAQLSSKSVMEKFNSSTVLQDRITLPRASKESEGSKRRNLSAGSPGNTGQPLIDLSYTHMNFLRDDKTNIAPQPLSSRRLRELERQNKEIEELSSYFTSNDVTKEHTKFDMAPSKQSNYTPVGGYHHQAPERGHNGEILGVNTNSNTPRSTTSSRAPKRQRLDNSNSSARLSQTTEHTRPLEEAEDNVNFYPARTPHEVAQARVLLGGFFIPQGYDAQRRSGYPGDIDKDHATERWQNSDSAVPPPSNAGREAIMPQSSQQQLRMTRPGVHPMMSGFQSAPMLNPRGTCVSRGPPFTHMPRRPSPQFTNGVQGASQSQLPRPPQPSGQVSAIPTRILPSSGSTMPARGIYHHHHHTHGAGHAAASRSELNSEPGTTGGMEPPLPPLPPLPPAPQLPPVPQTDRFLLEDFVPGTQQLIDYRLIGGVDLNDDPIGNSSGPAATEDTLIQDPAFNTQQSAAYTTNCQIVSDPEWHSNLSELLFGDTQHEDEQTDEL